MPLDEDQTTAYFEGHDGLGLSATTRARLAKEGIVEVSDLVEFDKDSINMVASNIRKGAAANAILGAKAQKRMTETADLLCFYQAIGREVTTERIQYEVIHDFSLQWKALQDRKATDQAKPPMMSKELGILKWSEAFYDFLDQTIGVRGAPLSYVTRAHAVPPGDLPEQAEGKPHSVKNGSVKADLREFATHDSPMYREDKGRVYKFLEEALRGTAYVSSLKPFQRSKDGHEAHKAIISQYAGVDKWDAELKRCNTLLNTHQWKGNSNFTFEKFVSQHRNAFISMQ